MHCTISFSRAAFMATDRLAPPTRASHRRIIDGDSQPFAEQTQFVVSTETSYAIIEDYYNSIDLLFTSSELTLTTICYDCCRCLTNDKGMV